LFFQESDAEKIETVLWPSRIRGESLRFVLLTGVPDESGTAPELSA